ncbi:hypothetical protein P0Y35_10155 [Kiritimatiellaeota bacterium B1221]|nr:hypothetical protein [Kiritimatiellaeota bacterium B1221]
MKTQKKTASILSSLLLLLILNVFMFLNTARVHVENNCETSLVLMRLLTLTSEEEQPEAFALIQQQLEWNAINLVSWQKCIFGPLKATLQKTVLAIDMSLINQTENGGSLLYKGETGDAVLEIKRAASDFSEDL